MIPLQLQEFGPAKWVELEDRERVALEAANASWKKSLGLPDGPLVIERDGSRVAISARHAAGTIRVGSVGIEIAPKFLDTVGVAVADWRQAFWQILLIARQGRSLLGRAAGADVESASIADLLADIFITSYSRGSLRGLPLQYAVAREVAGSVRGAFDPSRFAEWHARPWRVPIVETFLSPLTPLAELLGWAAAQLRTLVAAPARARELDTVRHELPRGMRAIPSLADAERLQLGVQHEVLRPALEVALLLLRGHGIRQGAGDRDVIGFLWKSDDVYERFLFWLCREAGRSRGLYVTKTSAWFGISPTAKPLMTTPDVTFAGPDARVVAILDAKYKVLDSKPKPSDSYQVLTGATHFGADRVGLVYPASGIRPTVDWTVQSRLGAKPVVISALSLDLLEAATLAGRCRLVDDIGTWLDGGGGVSVGGELVEPAAP